MPNYLHRTTKIYLTSVSPVSLPESSSNYIQDPDLSTVGFFPSRYWIITGDTVSLMDQTARDVVDAALATASKDGLAAQYDLSHPNLTRALAEVMLDEFNVLRVRAGLNARTLSQLKTAIRSKLDG